MGRDGRRRVGTAILLGVLVAACGGGPASHVPGTPAPVDASADARSPSTTQPSPSVTAPATTLAKPYPEERWDAEAPAIIDAFAADLAGQYDGIDRAALDRWFTPDGLASAREQDWRLRAVLDREFLVDGDVVVRYGGTSRTALGADPPLVEVELAFVVEPTSWLVDADGGTVLERFDHPRYFGATYTMRYTQDTEQWRVTAVAPSAGDAWMGPEQPRSAARCPGLDPGADGGHPVASMRWCFGGADGTRAYSSQVLGWEHVPCGIGDVTVLTVGWPIGQPIDPFAVHAFVRDPDGEFGRTWPLDVPWQADVTLPDDAYSTGLTDGEYEVWVSPAADASAIWVRRDGRFERWPRAGEWGVTDCN